MFKYLAGIALVLVATIAQAERIRDLTSVQGVRQNSLIGYGLVVGLDGTGDQTTQTPFTTQSLNNTLWRRATCWSAVRAQRQAAAACRLTSSTAAVLPAARW